MEKIIFSLIIGIIYYGYQAYIKFKENEAKKAKSIPKEDKPYIPEFKNTEVGKRPLETHSKSIETKPKTNRPAPMYTPGKTPPVSLEDLLKQFNKPNAAENVENYEEKPVKKPQKQVDKYVDEEELARQKMLADRAAALELRQREPLKEVAFAAYKEAPVQESEYAQLLKTPDGARKAFVLSEILGRRF